MTTLPRASFEHSDRDIIDATPGGPDYSRQAPYCISQEHDSDEKLSQLILRFAQHCDRPNAAPYPSFSETPGNSWLVQRLAFEIDASLEFATEGEAIARRSSFASEFWVVFTQVINQVLDLFQQIFNPQDWTAIIETRRDGVRLSSAEAKAGTPTWTLKFGVHLKFPNVIQIGRAHV